MQILRQAPSSERGETALRPAIAPLPDLLVAGRNRSVSSSEMLALAMIFVLALLLRVAPMRSGLGQDELFTIVNFVEVNSFWTTVSSSGAFNNHIGYSLLARLAEIVFGRADWSFRLPALFFGMASLSCVWLLFRSLIRPSVALTATALLALTPAHIVWSAQARGYSGMMFCTLLSSYYFLRLCSRASRSSAIAFVAVSVLGVYIHLYSVLVTLVQVLIVTVMAARGAFSQRWTDNHRSVVKYLAFSFLAIAVVSFVCYLPALQSMLGDIVSRESAGTFIPEFPLLVLQDLSGNEHVAVVALMFLVYAYGLFIFIRSHPFEGSYFACLALVPLCIMWMARPYDLYPRFFVYYLPYYILFLAFGLYTIGSIGEHYSRFVRSGLYILIAAGVLLILYGWQPQWMREIPDEGYRDASRAVLAGADDSTTFCAIGGARSVWAYYIEREIAKPQNLDDLLALSKNHHDVRCVYYQASWQSVDQTAIADYLSRHGSHRTVKDSTVFWYRN
jgi:hypothetical protein